MTTKQIRVVGEIGDGERAILVVALQMMTAVESMRSALRGLGRLPQDGSPATEADRYYLLFAAIGAAGEAIKVIKAEARAGRVDDSMLGADEVLLGAWERVMETPVSREVKVALRARDKYWAHWDDSIAANFIASLRGNDDDPPMIESSGEGEHANSSYRWVRLAWFADIEGQCGLTTGDEAVELIERMMEFVRDMQGLAGNLVLHLIRRTGLNTVATSAEDSET